MKKYLLGAVLSLGIILSPLLVPRAEATSTPSSFFLLHDNNNKQVSEITVKVGDGVNKFWGSTNGGGFGVVSPWQAYWSAETSVGAMKECSKDYADGEIHSWNHYMSDSETAPNYKVLGHESHRATEDQVNCTITIKYVVTGAVGTNPSTSIVTIKVIDKDSVSTSAISLSPGGTITVAVGESKSYSINGGIPPYSAYGNNGYFLAAINGNSVIIKGESVNANGTDLSIMDSNNTVINVPVKVTPGAGNVTSGTPGSGTWVVAIGSTSVTSTSCGVKNPEIKLGNDCDSGEGVQLCRKDGISLQCSSKANGPQKYSGIVLDSVTKNPINGVIVRLSALENQGVDFLQTVTDSNGKWEGIIPRSTPHPLAIFEKDGYMVHNVRGIYGVTKFLTAFIGSDKEDISLSSTGISKLVCLPGTTISSNGTSCIDTTVHVCATGMVWNGSSCAITTNTNPTAPSCVSPMIWNGNSCVTTPVTSVPRSPTLVSVIPGNGRVTLNFTAPANTGGSAIISYVSSCGNQVATGGSPTVVTGLTNGTQYSCTVKAVNAVGTSVASNAINVTPTSIVAGNSAPSCTITVNKSVLTDKEPIVLSWDTQNTVAATLTGTGIDSPGFDALRQKAYGTYPFRIFSLGSSATYTLTVKNAAGTSATCSTPTLTIVSASLRQSVTTTTSDGTTGQPFTLSWNSSNIGACKLSKTVTPVGGAEGASVAVACYSADTNSYGDAFHTNGSCQPTPIVAGVHKFTFTCGSTVGEVSESVTHTVTSIPTASITQTKTSTVAGESYNIFWDSRNTSSCSVQYSRNGEAWVTYSTAWTSDLPITISPIVVGTHIWQITCSGSGGTVGGTATPTSCPSGSTTCFTHTVNAAQTASALNAFDSATNADTDRTTTSNAAGFSYVWNRDLQIGSSYTSDVSALQTALARESVYAGEITGGFYDQTYIAVRKFQQKYGIKESGYVGTQTRVKLNSLYWN